MYLLLDIGGTKTRIATSLDGQQIESTQILDTPKYFEDGIKLIKNKALEYVFGEQLEGMIIGFAGTLNKEKNKILSAPNLSRWSNQPLKETLQDVLHTPVFLENDSALVGLGEATSGAGKGTRIVGFLIIGTGVGGVRIVDGKIDENSLGFEPGHQIIVPNGNKCGCGGKGHLESYVSGSAIEKIYKQQPADIANPHIWEEIALWLAIGLNNTIVHWSPDTIVLGGSITNSLPIEQLRRFIKENLNVFPHLPAITTASLGDEAGLYGGLQYLKLIGKVQN